MNPRETETTAPSLSHRRRWIGPWPRPVTLRRAGLWLLVLGGATVAAAAVLLAPHAHAAANPTGTISVREAPSPEPIPPPNPKQHNVVVRWSDEICGIARIRIVKVGTGETIADMTYQDCPLTAALNASPMLGSTDQVQTLVTTCGPGQGRDCCTAVATDEVKSCPIQGATYMTVADEGRTDREMRTLTCPGAPNGSIWAVKKSSEGDLTPQGAAGATFAVTATHSSKTADDVTISRTHADGDGDVSTSESKLTVIGIDMKIHKPPVVGGGEPQIPDADELTKGAQTFVNLDNDDGDTDFDTQDVAGDDTDVAGEDEMCKVRLRIRPKNLPNPAGNVKLDVTAGPGLVKLWRAANKGTEYMPGANLAVPAEFTAVGDWLEKTLWLEGRAPATMQQETKLKMTYDVAPTFKDEVAATIVGIDKIEWVGRSNSHADTNALDEDAVKWPMGLAPGSLRVFPDARRGAGGVEANPRDTVDVKVTLTVDPIENLAVFFDSVDVDDPSSANGPLDGSTAATNEDQAEDNRGTVPARSGRFVRADGTNDEDLGGVKAQGFTTKVATFRFQVTMQPGDNFRIAGNGDRDFILDLRNPDPEYATSTNEARQRLINRHTTGFSGDREIRQVDHYASNRVLTVWRNLHVEVDSMGNVAGNTVSGNVTTLNTGDSTTATVATLSVNVRDGSPDQGTAPAGNGRFEAGTLRVADTHDIAMLTGNGLNTLTRTAGLDVCATALPFAALGGGGANMAGTVTRVDSGSRRLHLTPNAPPANWGAFVNGNVRIGGGPAMMITAVDAANSRVTVNGLQIPFTLRDDDAQADGTDVANPDTGGMAIIYGAAYVRPLFDTGQDTDNATFRLNSPATGAGSPTIRAHLNESRGSPASTARYWVVILKNGFQTDANQDCDADAENTWRAIGPPGTYFGALFAGMGGALALEESIRDWIAAPAAASGAAGVDPDTTGDPPPGDASRQSRRREIINHEIGHTFGLVHPDGNPTADEPNGGVMRPSCCPANLRQSSNFTRLSLHRIRSVPFPG